MTLARVVEVETSKMTFILELFLLVSVLWTLCSCSLAKRQGAEWRHRETWL